MWRVRSRNVGNFKEVVEYAQAQTHFGADPFGPALRRTMCQVDVGPKKPVAENGRRAEGRLRETGDGTRVGDLAATVPHVADGASRRQAERGVQEDLPLLLPGQSGRFCAGRHSARQTSRRNPLGYEENQTKLRAQTNENIMLYPSKTIK